MVPEKTLRRVLTVHGEKTENYEFLDLRFLDSDFQDISYKILDKSF